MITELYKEEQRFGNGWIKAGLILAGLSMFGFFGFGFYQQLILDKPFGDNPMSNTGLVVTFILVFLLYCFVFYLLQFARLITQIDSNGINYRFVPFHFKFYQIKKEEIDSFKLVTYRPIRDYGGWGIRYGKNGKAYNVTGNQGLIIQLHKGKTILLGTQRPEALNRAMTRMMERS